MVAQVPHQQVAPAQWVLLVVREALLLLVASQET
jgi:hypothetical protein